MPARNVAKRRASSFGRNEALCAAAVVAAHAIYAPHGARQRDVKFFLQLFSNWLEHAVGEDVIEIKNMQVSRFLSRICAEGYARELKRRPPLYLLNRAGIVELLRMLTEQPLYRRPNLLLFVRFFVLTYRETILKLATLDGQHFPPALRLEIESLLDAKRLLRRQRELAEEEHAKLKLRLKDTRHTAELARELFKKGRTPEEITAEVEKHYPYELNSQKPMRELFASFPPGQAFWEHTSGAEHRAEELWAPMEHLWHAYSKLLEDLNER